MDKDQKAFIKHCRDVFGARYGALRIEAQRASQSAKSREPVSYKKDNAGLKAGNLLLLSELEKIGCEVWRVDKNGNKPVSKHTHRATGANVNSGVVNNNPLPQGVKGIKLDW